jgi:hypothetical protein
VVLVNAAPERASTAAHVVILIFNVLSNMTYGLG